MGELGPVLLSSPLKTSGTLYLLSGMCLLAFLHVLLLLPETKVRTLLLAENSFVIIDYTIIIYILLACMQGRSLEDIEVLFTESWLKRTDIVYYLR